MQLRNKTPAAEKPRLVSSRLPKRRLAIQETRLGPKLRLVHPAQEPRDIRQHPTRFATPATPYQPTPGKAPRPVQQIAIPPHPSQCINPPPSDLTVTTTTGMPPQVRARKGISAAECNGGHAQERGSAASLDNTGYVPYPQRLDRRSALSELPSPPPPAVYSKSAVYEKPRNSSCIACESTTVTATLAFTNHEAQQKERGKTYQTAPASKPASH
jgi:hypothetical protein